MFYLKTFYSVLLKKPLSAALWSISLLLIFVSFTGKTTASKYLTLKTTPKDQRPYFFAVMPKGINTGYVKRKLLNLPGVDKVNVMAKESIVGHVKSILESTQLQWDKDILDLDYAGVKVFLSPDLKPRSQSLIRNYLTRIAGEKDVTLGAIRSPKKEEKTVTLGSVFNKSFDVIPLVGVALFLLSLFTIRKDLGKKSFIIETYQRKSNVFERGMAFAQAPILGAMALMAYLHGTVAIISLVAMALGIALLIGLGQKTKEWI